MTLTNKQRAFVIEYVKDFNATQAAIRAGYSERTASTIGYENINKPHIKQAIGDYFAENAMTAREVISRLTDIGRGLRKDATVSDELRSLDLLAKYHQLTTTTQVKTWRDDAIDAIKAGDIDYDAFVETFQDESLAKQLFMQAGVPIEN